MTRHDAPRAEGPIIAVAAYPASNPTLTVGPRVEAEDAGCAPRLVAGAHGLRYWSLQSCMARTSEQYTPTSLFTRRGSDDTAKACPHSVPVFTEEHKLINAHAYSFFHCCACQCVVRSCRILLGGNFVTSSVRSNSCKTPVCFVGSRAANPAAYRSVLLMVSLNS